MAKKLAILLAECKKSVTFAAQNDKKMTHSGNSIYGFYYYFYFSE